RPNCFLTLSLHDALPISPIYAQAAQATGDTELYQREKYLHETAKKLAHQHSMDFIASVLDGIFADEGQYAPVVLLGLMDDPILKNTTQNLPQGPIPGQYEDDCPNPQTQHIHDKDWLDVTAHKLNDTGLVVKEGEVWDITVKPDGLIELYTGLLSAKRIGPGGDSSIRLTFLGYTPPLETYPI